VINGTTRFFVILHTSLALTLDYCW